MNVYTINKRKTIKLSPQVLPSYTHHLPWHNHVFLVSRKIYRYNKIYFMMFMAWQAYFVKNFCMYRYTAKRTDIYDDDEPHVPMKTKPYHRQLWERLIVVETLWICSSAYFLVSDLIDYSFSYKHIQEHHIMDFPLRFLVLIHLTITFLVIMFDDVLYIDIYVYIDRIFNNLLC